MLTERAMPPSSTQQCGLKDENALSRNAKRCCWSCAPLFCSEAWNVAKLLAISAVSFGRCNARSTSNNKNAALMLPPQLRTEAARRIFRLQSETCVNRVFRIKRKRQSFLNSCEVFI